MLVAAERASETPGGGARLTGMPPAGDPASDLVLPSFDTRVLARRAACLAIAVAVGALAIVAAGGPLRTFADALGRALDADPRWVAAAAAFELLSFAGHIALLWLVGSRASGRLGLRASAEITLGGAAATRLLPTGGVGGAALTLWAFRRAGLGLREATRTLFAFLVVLYSVFLASIAVTGVSLALGLVHGDGPPALSAVPAVAATLAMAAALGLAARRPAISAARSRPRDVADTLGAGVRDALALMRGGDVRLLGAVAWWAFDGAVLWAMLHALGGPPALAVVVLAYFVGQVGNTIPVPGAVSGGIVGVLLAFGVEADLALASVLAYRCVAIWLPAAVGMAALGSLRRTLNGWGREHDLTSGIAATPPARARIRSRHARRPDHRRVERHRRGVGEAARA